MPAGKRFLWRDRDGKIIGPKGGKAAYYTEECCCLDGNGCWFRFESVCNETDGTWSEPLLVRAGCMPRPPDAPLEGEPRWRHDPNNRNRAFLWVEKKLTGPDGNPVPCTPENCPGEPPEVAPPDLMCACEPFGLSYDGGLPMLTCEAVLHEVGYFRPGSEVPERTEWLYTPELPVSAESGLEVRELSRLSASLPLYLDNYEDSPSLRRSQECWFPDGQQAGERAWKEALRKEQTGTHSEWSVSWTGGDGYYRSATLCQTPHGPMPVRSQEGVRIPDCTLVGGVPHVPENGILVPLPDARVSESQVGHPRVLQLGAMGSFAYDQWGYIEYAPPHVAATGPAAGAVGMAAVRECRGDFALRQDILCVDTPLDGYYLPGAPMWHYRAHLVTSLDIGTTNLQTFAAFAGEGHQTAEPVRIQADLSGIFCPTYYHLYLTAAWGMCPDDPGMVLPQGLGQVTGEHCRPVSLVWRVDSNPASQPDPFWSDGTYSPQEPDRTDWIHETDELVKPAPGTRPGDPDNPDWYDPQSQGYRRMRETDGHAYRVIRLCIDNYPTWFASQHCGPELRAEDLEVPVPSYGEDAYYCQTCRDPYPYPDQPPPPPELDLCGWTPENASSSLRLWMDALTKEGSYRGTYGPVDPVPHVGGGVAADCDQAVTSHGMLEGVPASDGHISFSLEPVYGMPACPDMPYRLCPAIRHQYKVYKKIYEDSKNPTVPSWHPLHVLDWLEVTGMNDYSVPTGQVGWHGLPSDPRRCGLPLPDPYAFHVPDKSGERQEDGVAVKYEGASTVRLALVTDPDRCCDRHRCGDTTLPEELGSRPYAGYDAEQYYRAVAAFLRLYSDQLPDMGNPEDSCPGGYLAKGTAVEVSVNLTVHDGGHLTRHELLEILDDKGNVDYVLGREDTTVTASCTGSSSDVKVRAVADRNLPLGADWVRLPAEAGLSMTLQYALSLDREKFDGMPTYYRAKVKPGNEERTETSHPAILVRRVPNSFGRYRLEVELEGLSGYWLSLPYDPSVLCSVEWSDGMSSGTKESTLSVVDELTPASRPKSQVDTCSPDPRLLHGTHSEPRMWEPVNADSGLDRGFAVPSVTESQGICVTAYTFSSSHTWQEAEEHVMESSRETRELSGSRKHSLNASLSYLRPRVWFPDYVASGNAKIGVN